MKLSNIIISGIAIVSAIGLFVDSATAGKVRGYYRKDGTYVRPHYRRNPSSGAYIPKYNPSSDVYIPEYNTTVEEYSVNRYTLINIGTQTETSVLKTRTACVNVDSMDVLDIEDKIITSLPRNTTITVFSYNSYTGVSRIQTPDGIIGYVQGEKYKYHTQESVCI